MSPTIIIGWRGARTYSPEETRLAGVEFAGHLKPGNIVGLHGELGSGKTTFVQGMAKGLGLDDQVTSPTFALVHEHGQPPGLYHIDCYRETSLERWRQLGLAEYFSSEAISVVEWAENIAPLLPEKTIHLTFSHGLGRNERTIEVRP